jgi:hypothetical protein
MPAASPLPRAPSVLTLSSAADLLTERGCPVCRYAAEAADRYLVWFALEAHADSVFITRLGASLGMCARHTRGLMSQPGAAARLTAVYQYILQAAQAPLAGPNRRPAACPGCAHDQAAAARALGTLLEGLEEPGVQARCRDVGGLCVPHAHAAALARRQCRAAAWLVRVTIDSLHGPARPLAVLAGGPDHDAAVRARLRARLPPPGHAPSDAACRVCAAVAGQERDQLTSLDPAGSPAWAGACLCPRHLRDAVLTAPDDFVGLLTSQAKQQAARLAASARGKPLVRRRRRPLAGGCPVCQACEGAAQRELRYLADMPAGPGAGDWPGTLCVRHVLALRPARSPAARAAAALAARRADALTAELATAFRKGTWEHRHEPRGREATAWQRAAVFLDGGVSGGAPA